MKPIFASILLFAACSSDPLDPGAGSDPGTGTSTLFVQGRASAEPRLANARLETDFTTDFEISISLNNNPVTTGTVTVTSRFGQTPLTWDNNSGNNGQWVGTMASYDEVYRFDVVAGADELRGVIVDGPDLHVFSEPMQGATVDSTVATPVRWSRDDSAEVTTFRTDQIDRINISDSGEYMLGVGGLRAERDRARENEIEVRRTNRVTPSGALGGSELAVTIRNELTVLAAPNPAL
jgi:hypothetical protein